MFFMNTTTGTPPAKSERAPADLDSLIEDLTNLRRKVGGRLPVYVPGNVSSIPLLRARASAIDSEFPIHLMRRASGPCIVLLGS
jgi:hypothetical protein